MTLEAIRYKRGEFSLLNQLLLPHDTGYERIRTVEDGWQAIRQMKVRGAPAIAIVAALSIATELNSRQFSSAEEIAKFVEESFDHLRTSRPTAVNLFKTADELTTLARKLAKAADGDLKETLLQNMETMLEKDVADNKAIGTHGAKCILSHLAGTDSATVLTHCNTGSLATAGYGTALGVVRSIHSAGKLENVFFTETRPYLQGARLTAFELVHDAIPSTLIPDSAAAALMQSRQLSAVVVGADRITANGDTANKIGTYQLAVVAKQHGVPFYVAAPTTSIDLSLATGNEIRIEERPADELRCIRNVAIAPLGVRCWNPAFDVTPANLIAGIITEIGVFSPSDLALELHRLSNDR